MSSVKLQGDGHLEFNGVEVRYVDALDLIPKPNRHAYVDTMGLGPLIHKLFQDDKKRWSPVNTILAGPPGCGKSLFWHYFAQEYQIPFLTHVCSEGSRDSHWKGCFTIKDKTTPFILGALASAIQTANESPQKVAMLLLEELNSLPPPIQKMLNSVTDFRTMVDITELGWRLELAPDSRLIIVGTCVTGPGTYALNEDLISRFEVFNLSYPETPEQELEIVRKAKRSAQGDSGFWITAATFVRAIQTLRSKSLQATISTREVVRLVEVAQRLSWESATYLLLQKFQASGDRNLVESHLHDMGWQHKARTLKDCVECIKTPNP